MLLPFREHFDFGPTPYDQLQAKEGIPVVKGNVYQRRDYAGVRALGANGRVGLFFKFFAPAADRRLRVAKIPAGQPDIAAAPSLRRDRLRCQGAGATSVWQEGTAKVTFEWGAGAIFAIPLNSSYCTSTARATKPSVCLSARRCRA